MKYIKYQGILGTFVLITIMLALILWALVALLIDDGPEVIIIEEPTYHSPL